jgi:tetratricopeptide (TPR) repeat protein
VLLSALVVPAALLPRESLADLVVPGDVMFPSFFSDELNETDARAVLRLEGRPGGAAFADWPGLVARGNYREALAFANRYLQSEPNSGLAHEARGTALLMLREIDEAEQAFREATRVEAGQSGPWFKLGMIQMEDNRLDQAESSLEKALAIEPTNRFAHQRLAMLLAYLGRDNEAITHYRQGLVGTPVTYVGIAVDLGRLLNRYGRFAETIEVLEPRLPVSSDVGEASYVLATAYLNTARFADAEARFERALELGVAPMESRLGIALSQRERGELAAAMQNINQLIDAAPDSPLFYLERGKTHLAEGRPELATQDFETAEKMGASPLTGAKGLARYYAEKDELGSALRVLRTQIDSGDADPETYTLASELYLADEQADAGLAVLERGAGAYPDSSYLAFRTASFLATTGQYAQSLSWFERALDGQPRDPVVLRAFSLALSRAGELTRSAEVAGDLYALRPDRPAVAVFYATRLEGAGQFAEAESVYRDLLARTPDVPLVLNNLASILAEREEYEEAAQFARRANELVPDNGRLLDTLGWALYGNGDYDEAAAVLRQAVSLEPALAVVQYHHGVAELKAGEAERAAAALSRALELAPQASWATEARGYLEQATGPITP